MTIKKKKKKCRSGLANQERIQNAVLMTAMGEYFICKKWIIQVGQKWFVIDKYRIASPETKFHSRTIMKDNGLRIKQLDKIEQTFFSIWKKTASTQKYNEKNLNQETPSKKISI